MRNVKVSVIVPVYNTYNYLTKCLNSLVSQTLEDIEIVIVNDGTKDDSQEIIDKFAIKYPNKIKAFQKENGGLSSARNFGIKEATGEYIGFVDSDDYVSCDMFEKLYNKAKLNDFDIVECGLKFVYEKDRKEKKAKQIPLIETMDKDKIKEHMTVMYPVVWNKIYKSEIIKKNNILFKEGVWYEDVEWTLRLYSKVNKISFVKDEMYYYLQRKDSISYTYNEKLYDLINNMDSVITYFEDQDIYKEYSEELEYLYTRYAYATFPKRLAKSKDSKLYKEGINYAIINVNKNFPEYKKNKYMLKNKFKGLYIKNFSKFFSNINYIINRNKK